MLHRSIFSEFLTATWSPIYARLPEVKTKMAAQHCTLRRRNFIQIILLIDALEEENEEKTRDRQVWARDWMRRRQARGAFHQLVPELASEDEEAFINYFRMNQVKFHFVTARIQEKIAKKNTLMREAISPAERLAVTLRYLATGETFSSLEKQFRISRTAISAIVIEVSSSVVKTKPIEYTTCTLCITKCLLLQKHS